MNGRTLVFIPALNEEESLPVVLDELRTVLGEDADVLVVDDGSKDGTAAVARAHGASVVSFGENRGLRHAVARGYAEAYDRGYDFCGRVDADGQHPAHELKRLLRLVQLGECDVAVGSRFVAGEGYPAYRYRPSWPRRLGTAVLRRALRLRLGQPFADATSGLYAANRSACRLLKDPYYSRAPEVEGLFRLRMTGLKVLEVPVDMRERSHGLSRLRGGTALKLVLTVAGTVVLGRRLQRLLSR